MSITEPTDVIRHSAGDTGPGPTRATMGDRRSAWQREMERAQAAAWFKQPLPDPPGHELPAAAAAASRHPRVRSTHASDLVVARGPQQWSNDAVVNDGALLPGTNPAERPPQPQQAGQLQQPARAFFVHGQCIGGAALTAASKTSVPDRTSQSAGGIQAAYGRQATLAKVTEATVSTGKTRDVSPGGRFSDAAPPTQPVRIHVQWQGREAHVWLGLDATFSQRLPELTSSIVGWLRARGTLVSSLVCNGKARPVHDALHAASAPPLRGRTGPPFDQADSPLNPVTGETS